MKTVEGKPTYFGDGDEIGRAIEWKERGGQVGWLLRTPEFSNLFYFVLLWQPNYG